MKIMHTADVHLKRNDIETRKTLKEIISLGTTHNIDLLTIGGDFFDSPEDANALRVEIRNIFNTCPFPVLVIPGNHDENVFKENLDFGTQFIPLTLSPLQIYPNQIDESVNIVGIPFVSRVTDELLIKITEARDVEKTNILLMHCTLDFAFSPGDFGENEHKYFEIDRRTLLGLSYDFILGGHFHSRFDKRQLSPECIFVYPGSPISLTWKELGTRSVALLDTESKTLDSLPLEESYFRECFSINIQPQQEENLIQQIDSWIEERSDKNADLRVIIEGYGEMDEITFREKINDLLSDVNLINNYQDVSAILDHPLYQLFLHELTKLDDSVDHEELKRMVIKAISNVIGGDI